ncbi:LRIQ1 protein, partial [Alcedo cyanopectus]|nr:LRIQ1 protein [Ceyx cyanopectus]
HTRRKSDCSNTENHQCREALRHQAATLIQAFWKGFLLRKKLASARAGVLSDGGEDDYREINVDDFIFSEPADPSAHSARLPLSPQQAWQCANRPHSCLEENTHFCSRSEKAKMSQLSDWKEKKNSFMSEKEEKISEEWGFKDISTAQLMLKRAHKMKPKKYNNKTLEPAVSPAFFRNRENKYLHGKPPRKTQPRNSGYFEG